VRGRRGPGGRRGRGGRGRALRWGPRRTTAGRREKIMTVAETGGVCPLYQPLCAAEGWNGLGGAVLVLDRHKERRWQSSG